jgi:hypothetical protein
MVILINGYNMKYPWRKYTLIVCSALIVFVAALHVLLLGTKKESFVGVPNANLSQNQNSCSVSAKIMSGLDYNSLSPTAKLVIEDLDPSIISLPDELNSNKEFSGECIIRGGNDKSKTQYYRLQVDELSNVCRPVPLIGLTKEESDIELPYYKDGEGRTGCAIDLRAGNEKVNTLLNKLYALSKKEVTEERKVIDGNLTASTNTLNDYQNRSTILEVAKTTADASTNRLNDNASSLSSKSTGLKTSVSGLGGTIDSHNGRIKSLEIDINAAKNNPLPSSASLKEELKACNKQECNKIMQDYIVTKYWAFNDTANTMGECNKCPSRWFKGPNAVSTNGVNFSYYGNQRSAYNAAALM